MEQQKQRPKQGRSLTRKIIEAHYVKGSLTPGEEVFLRVDQTLTHDINAVMTYLAFEAIGLPRVRTECSVSYLDHNLLYIDHKTPDDHIYLQSAARKCGVWSRGRATASAMQCMRPALACRARSAWVATATRPTAEPSECSASVWAAWT